MKNIKCLINYEKGFFSISSGLFIGILGNNVVHITQLVKNVSLILLDMSKISFKGYINNPRVDLPLLRWLMDEYKLNKVKKSVTSYSIQLNTLYFNLVLLLLLNVIIEIEK